MQMQSLTWLKRADRYSNQFQLSLNPCLMTLKLLNAFSLSSVHTRLMDEVDLQMPGWRKIEEKLKKHPHRSLMRAAADLVPRGHLCPTEYVRIPSSPPRSPAS